MEFWAVEVKSGEALKVQPGEGMVLHLSQACIGEVKKEKGNESVCLFVNVDEKKLVLGTLFCEKLPQQQYDLVFDRDFSLSHNWRSGSVFFYGYKAMNPIDDEDDEEDSDSESEEDIPITFENNEKPDTKVTEGKTAVAKKVNAEKNSTSGKSKVKIIDPNEDKDKDDSSDEDDSISEDKDDEDEDEDGSMSEDDSDEETPQKVATGKKRTADSAVKTPRPDKKAKVSPQKTDGKKGGGHVATPHPSKQAGKTPAGKSLTCKSCSKTFGSQAALESHSKAKHSAGK